MKKSISRICILIAMLIVLPLMTTVSAAEDISIELRYNPGACTFQFYKIADISQNGEPTLTDQFKKYTDSVTSLNSLGSLNAEEVRALSTTLEAIVLRDGLLPLFEVKTDQNGVLVKNNPDRAVYLILGEQTKDTQYVYTPAPLLISVPTRLDDGNEQNHIIIEHTKVQKEQVTDKTTQYKVRKIWKDSKYKAFRPSSITVELLQNGKVYDVVSLSQENNWMYEWKNLPKDYNWTAAEKSIPKHYTLTVEKEQMGIVLTNTYHGPTPPPKEEIPPTGQLWWPVPLFTVLGIAMLAIGLSGRRKETL